MKWPCWSSASTVTAVPTMTTIRGRSGPRCRMCWRAPIMATQRSAPRRERSEEHTSELQSPCKLVCRLLLEKTNAYFHPLLHAEVVKHDFEQIRAIGAGSIVYAVHEQEAHCWPRDLERALRHTQQPGLNVYC